MQIGTILKRGSTTIEVIGVRDDKPEVRIRYPEFPDMEVKEWYPVSLLLRSWEVAK